jgi:hypothetical protein
MNGRSLSHSTLSPPGRLAAQMDGGFHIDMIDVLIKTYGTSRPADGPIAQSFQSTARAGWPRFSLAVARCREPFGNTFRPQPCDTNTRSRSAPAPSPFAANPRFSDCRAVSRQNTISCAEWTI